MPRHITRIRRSGFTLIELLIVIGIGAVLVSMLLPGIQQAREAARGVRCRQNLKQIGIALHAYHEAHRAFPPGCGLASSPPDPGYAVNLTSDDTAKSYGWATSILPYLDQMPLYDRLNVNARDLNTLLLDPQGRDLARTVISSYRCPSDTAPDRNNRRQFYDSQHSRISLATSNYVGVHGTRWSTADDWIIRRIDPWGIFWPASHVRLEDITDGTSNTLLVGERSWDFLAAVWIGTRNYAGTGDAGLRQIQGVANWVINLPGDNAPRAFHSRHPGGTYFLFADGHVDFISQFIHFDNSSSNPSDARTMQGTYQRLGMRNDGQLIGSF